MSGMPFLVFLVVGVAGVVLFHQDIFFPIPLSVAIFTAASWQLWWELKRKRIGALMLLIWLVYALPFIHIVPYLWFDFATENPLVMWGLAVRPYMTDERVITLTAMLGAVGACGLMLGVLWNRRPIVNDSRFSPGGPRPKIRTLSTGIWLVWVVMGVLLSWLEAPAEWLFSARYTESASPLHTANFGSAWMISYVLLGFALCDGLLEQNRATRTLKLWSILFAIGYIAIVLQLLRGDRAILPFVIGAAFVWFYWARPATGQTKLKLPWRKLLVVGLLVQFVAMIVGSVRHSLTNVGEFAQLISLLEHLYEAGILGIGNMMNGTWSAVLLTPLSVAGDHIYGLLKLKLGTDYLDMLLSIPPGFLADAMDYTRPIDALTGPAWEMRYGIGGTHAVVVPFMNFRMEGVLVIQALIAVVLTRFEKASLKRLSVPNLALLCSLVMAAPKWLWYGEKSGINVFIIWFILAFAYRLSLSFTWQLHPTQITRTT